jgi:MFS transporter, DHA1 family, multidrug resistance protein
MNSSPDAPSKLHGGGASETSQGTNQGTHQGTHQERKELKEHSGRAHPGSLEFRFMLSASMALGALAIDMMLPSFPEIRADLGLAKGASSVGGLVTIFLFGMALGQIPSGLLTDRFGRRIVLRGAFVIMMICSVLAGFAPTLGLMLAVRLVWGMCAGAIRVVLMATVRDTFSGAAMAREMSFVMATFLLIPILAPSIGAAIVAVSNWRTVFFTCTGATLLTFIWTSFRFPETLPNERRRPISLTSVATAARAMGKSRRTMWLLVSNCVLMGAFSGYISGSSQIFDEVFNKRKAFPLIFGAMAAVMSIGIIANGKAVMRLGLKRLVNLLSRSYFVGSTAMLALALTTKGKPPLWLFLAILAVTIASHNTLLNNSNSSALEPLGSMAGTAAAVLGSTSMAIGSILGTITTNRFDGSITPLATSFSLAALFSLIAVVLAYRASPSPIASTPSAAPGSTPDPTASLLTLVD